MNDVRCVLVTGAGGPAGVAVVQELGRLGVDCVAADCDPGAVGLALAPRSTVIPRADDPRFLAGLVDAADEHACDALIATVAEELAVLAPAGAELARDGIAAWLPAPAALDRCTDKWAFAKALAGAGVAAPATALGTAEGVPGPWIVKPRFGRGSQDVLATDDPRDLPTLLRLVPDPIVQTRLPGRELSADCLVDDDGRVRGVVARWRSETRGGISTRGTTFTDPRVDALVADVVAATGITTCINVQAFLDETADCGRGAAVVEVNPRFSGALPLSLAAGADLVGQHLRHLAGLPVEDHRLVARPGVGFARYFAHVLHDPTDPHPPASQETPCPPSAP